MKKICLLAAAFIASTCSIAQDNDNTDSQNRMEKFATVKKHELSLDVTAAIGLPAFSPRYEYILGRYSGIGADLFIAFDNSDTDFSDYEQFSLTPYYRQYFFSKEDYGAKGFYAEGFVKFFTFQSGQVTFDQFGNAVSISEENLFETAIGVGIGWKWVSNSGFLVDLGFGLGRNLGIADDPFDNLAEVQLRGGLNFGWRF